jgi:hypothetical protein
MNYFNYFTEIEDEFVKRRGSHMWVSPLDWSLMETWKQRGVPLHIVLRGINVSFDAYDQRANRGRRVNSLFYCQQEVEAIFLEYRDSRIGSNGEGRADDADRSDGRGGGDSSFSKSAIIDYLIGHCETLKRLSRQYSSDVLLAETLERTAERLRQIIDDAVTVENISSQSLEMDLTMIEEVILDGLKEHEGEEKLAHLEQEGNQELHVYRQNMEKEIYRQTLNNFIARRLREQYHVPRLSLFYL